MRRTLLRLFAFAALLSAVAPGVAQADNSQGPIVRFATSLGNIDVQLLPQYAPNTVLNFLRYQNSGAYATTFFHRSVQPAPGIPYGIIQGGSYDVVNGQRQPIATPTSVNLEYNLPNARGTLAMARMTDPNSASSGWFFNDTDNSSTFGPSNGGGYAVFGQILSPGGDQVMDAIAAKAVIDDSADNGTTGAYGQLPVINYSGANPAAANTITPSNLIMSPVTVVNDATAPTITITQPTNGELFTQGYAVTPKYTCTDGPNSDGSAGTGVATCTSSTFDTSTPGQKTFTVSTTDYAGNATSQSVTYTVNPAPPAPKPIGTPPAPKPRAATPVAPALSGSLTAAKSGKLPLTLRCTTATRCTGTIALTMAAAHRRTVRVVSGRYAIAARRRTKLTLRLGSATMKLLRAHKHVALTLTLTPAGGRKHTQRVTLRLGAH
jgi:cyclophilin family peptidyl-prolyl cis-trans isomerase